MKTIHILCILLLFNLSAEAQSHKSNLIKTVVAINNILRQNKEAQFRADKKYCSLRKINALLQGSVFCLDSLTSDVAKSDRELFNIIKVKAFVINGNDINLMGINPQQTVQISNIRGLDLWALRKELSALQFICTQYSQQDPKFKCD